MTSTHVPNAVTHSSKYRVFTAWGFAIIESDGRNILRIWPPTEEQRPDDLPDALEANAPRIVSEFAQELVAYFAGEETELSSKAVVSRWLESLNMGEFQRAVSVALYRVPRGVTITYGELAAIAGYPAAARAAGSVCSKNPLPVLIPCHRVVRSGAKPGDVGAYGAGTGSAYKHRLLTLENSAFVEPKR